MIHNWADGTTLGPEPKKNAFAQAHGLADRFVVLHSGNLGLSQGLEHLVTAAAALRDLPDLVLVFQGDGVKRDALEGQARALGLANVRFLPYASRQDLRYAFGAADVQVVSLRRGLAGFIVPSKLYGILASRRPYVAAVESEGETARLTERYGSGLVVPAGGSGGPGRRDPAASITTRRCASSSPRTAMRRRPSTTGRSRSPPTTAVRAR